jgi:hypothetical protein
MPQLLLTVVFPFTICFLLDGSKAGLTNKVLGQHKNEPVKRDAKTQHVSKPSKKSPLKDHLERRSISADSKEKIVLEGELLTDKRRSDTSKQSLNKNEVLEDLLSMGFKTSVLFLDKYFESLDFFFGTANVILEYGNSIIEAGNNVLASINHYISLLNNLVSLTDNLLNNSRDFLAFPKFLINNALPTIIFR